MFSLVPPPITKQPSFTSFIYRCIQRNSIFHIIMTIIIIYQVVHYSDIFHVLDLSLFFVGSCGIEGEDDSYDFGSGAGFYVDASEEKWKTNYRMFSYVTKEVKDFNKSSLKLRQYNRISTVLSVYRKRKKRFILIITR